MMADASSAPGTAAVTDRRPIPRGVLPRAMQMWLMAGIAGVMVLIIFVVGRPEPAPRPAAVATPAAAPSPERMREYQDRLRIMEARAAQEAQANAAGPPAPAPASTQAPASAGGQDPIVAERRRREYESLFASNVVLSRRPDADRPDIGRSAAAAPTAIGGTTVPRPASSPSSIDDIADAVVRATARAAGPTSAPVATAQAPISSPSRGSSETAPPAQTGPISPGGPLHRILEGTIIDTVLTNRLDGGSAAPVNCLVTNPVYSHSGQQVVIPAGARLLGDTKPVQAFGETRLAVAFHRLLMPDGSTRRLDHPPALNQIGDAGLRDQVNQHYWSTFGAAAAVGLISGLAQFVGAAAFSGGTGDRTVIMAGGAADATVQASLQVMNRFLNRLPTVTIREGHRIKVYLTSDLDLPAYTPPAGS
jgi:type IV secretion system protein VirB10